MAVFTAAMQVGGAKLPAMLQPECIETTRHEPRHFTVSPRERMMAAAAAI